jgi:NAD-dependent DNA ligase
LGINHLGRRRVEIIRKNVKAKTGMPLFEGINDWLDGSLLKYKDDAGVPGVGEEIQASIDRSKNMILDLLTEVKIIKPVEVAPKSGGLAGLKFCLTGTMSRKRSEIAADIIAKGGLVFDEVSGSDVILVQADPTSASSKSKKALKLGAKIMSEDELNGMMA